MFRSPARRVPRTALAAGVALLALVAPASIAGALTAHAALPSCSVVSSAQIKSALGISVGSAKSTTPFTGQQKCLFAQGSNTSAVQVVFTAQSTSAFQAQEQAYGANSIHGLGDGAFAGSIHTTGMSASNLYVHKDGVLLALAAVVPLNKLESLAKVIIAKY